MSWPLSHDFNEAIQNPRLVFTDPELKAGEAVVGARGLPLPRSGNFADVYQVRGAEGKDWAVKCFTRPVVGLAERYARVSDALEQAKLPFVVGFTFLPEGMLVAGARRPVVKMEWVEGLLLNQVVRENAGRPAVLAALGQMWVRLCRRLREARIAHADLQHGNVLLVPGARPGAYGLKLIDYDGMYVPALANQPSGEVGHPAYQHPTRAATRAYSPDVDRFPHLVVLAALKGLEAAGPGLWERHDTGDNLLFTEDDFKKPAESKVMRELWKTEHPAVQALVGRLALACGKPIPQTPWVDEFAPDGDPSPLDNDARRAAAAVLGVSLPVPVTLPPEPTYGTSPVAVVVALPPEPAPVQEVDVELVEERKPEKKPEKKAERKRPAYRPPTKEKSNSRVLLIVGGILLLVGGVAAAVALSGNNRPPDDTVQNPGDGDNSGVPPKAKEPVEPKDKGPKEKEPKEKQPKDKEPKDKTIDPPPVKPPDLKSVGRVQVTQRWTADIGTDPPLTRLASSLDGSLVVVSGFRTGTVCLDAGMGTPVPGSANKTVSLSHGVIPLENGRFALPRTVGDGSTAIWDPKQKRWDNDLLKPIAGVGKIAGNGFVSRNARYLAFGGVAGADTPAPFKLKDVTADKVILEFDLIRAQAFFTADSTRVLVAERSGTCRWFKLPSGDPDGEWTYPKQGTTGVGPLAVSADGAVVFHEGRLVDHREMYHLLDGRNGQVLRSFPGPYVSHRGNPLSEDGRLVAVMKRESNKNAAIEVIESATGTVLARLTTPDDKEFLSVELLRDGSALVAVVGTVTKTPAETPQTVVRYDLIPDGVQGKDPKEPKDPPPSSGDPLDLKARWTSPLNGGRFIRGVQVAPESGLVFLIAPQGGFPPLDFKTGQPRKEFAGLTKPGITTFFSLDRGRIGTLTTRVDEVHLWDGTTGSDAGKIAVPDIPAGAGNAKSPRAVLSPNGKYLAVGRSGTPVADNPEVPFRVFDTETNKVLVSTTWKGGSAFFTADSARLLVAEWPGRVRWFKLPSGDVDDKFDLGPPHVGQRHMVYGISGDGSVIAYNGPAGLKGTEVGPSTLDGVSGKVLRPFRKHFFATEVAVSADGRRAALMLEVTENACTIEVVDAGTGDPLGRVRMVTGRAVPSFALAPDGRSLVVHDPEADKVHLFEVPDRRSP
jgi:hypothetical protein